MTAVGVILITYNSAPLIEPCLDALADASRHHEVRIAVVDNDSHDDTIARADAHRLAPTVIATGRNAGYAAGINVGMRSLAGCDAHLVLNPDCRFEPGAIDELVAALDETGASIAAPQIRDPEGSVSWSIHREPTILREWCDALIGTGRAGRHPALGGQETRAQVYERRGEVEWASGAALLITSACSEAVGEWDESYFLYSEESDFQMRARRAGHRVVYVPSAAAVHDEGDAPVSDRLWSLLTVNKVKLYRRFHGPLATAAYRVPVVVAEAIRAVRGRGPSRAALLALLSPGRRQALYPETVRPNLS